MTGKEASRGSLATRAAIASVATAVLLLLLKLYAAWATNSVAMLASLADTSLDLLASIVTLSAVRLAARPADLDHRFGHGKAEALAAMAQIGLITVSAAAIAWRAATHLLNGQESGEAGAGIIVSLVAIGLTLALIAYQKSVVARTGSVAIGADQLHYQSDLLLNLSVIVALMLDQYAGLTGADPLFGIFIAIWLLVGAWRASSSAIDQLMDREWPEERRRAFLAAAAEHPQARGIHDLRTRSSGTSDFAQFHIWVDPELRMVEAHHIVEAIEDRLALDFPGVEVLIHLDPEGQVDHPGDPLRERDETQDL